MVAILETLPCPRSKWQSPIPVNRNVLLKLLRWHNDKRMHLCYHIKFVTSYDFLNCSIGFFSFLFWVSTERWRRLAQFRWNEHLHYVCIPPEVRSLKGSKMCVFVCIFNRGRGIAYVHKLALNQSIPPLLLPQACPQPQPSPLTTPSWWSHCFIPPCNLHVWITQKTHSSLSQCVELIQLGGSPKLYMQLMLSCRLWGGNMIGSMRHPNPSHT